MPRKTYKSESDDTLPATPPGHLGRIAKAMWRKLVPVLNATNKMATIDKNLVEMYATQYEIYRMAYEDIKEHGQVSPIYKTVVSPVTGEILATDMTGYKRNPSTQIYSDAIRNMAKIGSELGLSPASRADLLKLELGNENAKQSITEQMKKMLEGDDD